MLALLLGICAQDEFRADLERATKKLAACKSYSFKVSHDMETNINFVPSRDVNAEGKYVDSTGLYIKGGGVEMFRKGKKTAFEDSKNEWRLVGSGGGEKDANEFLAAAAREPHLEIGNGAKDIGKFEVSRDLEDVEGVECICVSGPLTSEAATRLTAWADSYGSVARSASRSGSLKVYLDDKWTVRKYVLTTRLDGQVPFVDKAFVEVVTTTTLSDYNATELEPPAKAVEAIDGKKR